jgi:hypothetical protein
MLLLSNILTESPYCISFNIQQICDQTIRRSLARLWSDVEGGILTTVTGVFHSPLSLPLPSEEASMFSVSRQFSLVRRRIATTLTHAMAAPPWVPSTQGREQMAEIRFTPTRGVGKLMTDAAASVTS